MSNIYKINIDDHNFIFTFFFLLCSLLDTIWHFYDLCKTNSVTKTKHPLYIINCNPLNMKSSNMYKISIGERIQWSIFFYIMSTSTNHWPTSTVWRLCKWNLMLRKDLLPITNYNLLEYIIFLTFNWTNHSLKSIDI